MGLACERGGCKGEGWRCPLCPRGRTWRARVGAGHKLKITTRKDFEVVECNCSLAMASQSLCLWGQGNQCLQGLG